MRRALFLPLAGCLAVLLAACGPDGPPAVPEPAVLTVGPLTAELPVDWPRDWTADERTDAALLLGLAGQDGRHANTAVNADGSCGVGLRVEAGARPAGPTLPGLYPQARDSRYTFLDGAAGAREFTVDDRHTVLQAWDDDSATTTVGYVQVVCDDPQLARKLLLNATMR